MFKKPSRKAFIIRRIILSVLAVSAVAIIVTVAVLSMLGYRLNSNDGTLQQGALLQFDSRPSGADVYVDGSLISGKTATKQTVVAGNHSIEMKKQGYEDWSRSLTLAPGTLTWLNYSRLVPKDRPVKSVLGYGSLSQLEFSPDLKWAISHEKPELPSFNLIDLRSEDVKTAPVVLPESLYSDATTPDVSHRFEIIRWNAPSRHVLVKHFYGESTEWLVLDTSDMNRSSNVTRTLQANFSDIQFAGTNGTSLYGLTSDGVIRKLDLSAGNMSGGFVTNVQSFRMFSTNVLVYNGTHPEKADVAVVGVYRDGDEASSVLREAKAGVKLHIATSRYHSDDFVAIAEGSKVSILKGNYPSSQARSNIASLRDYASIDVPGGKVLDLSFSPAGEYVVAQTAGGFTSYEIEHNRTAAVSIDSSNRLQWLDDAHMWQDSNNSVTMMDFNGFNSHKLFSAAEGFDASLSQNGRFVYSVGKTEAGYSLQRIKMILE